MSECTNKKLREKLFACELAMLDDEERQELELHLYECDACYHDLDQFAGWAEYLRHSDKIRDSVLADGDQSGEKSKIWKLTPFLVGIAAVLVLVIFGYRHWWQAPEVGITQQITLVPSRAAGNNAIGRKLGGDVKIVFVAEGARPGRDYDVSIAARQGTVVHKKTFSKFNESGQGSIVVPVSIFETGFYNLTVTDPSVTPPVPLVEYTFRVE
jgi:hypothetical protein